MYLHSLEIMGFKSFPEKIRLKFSRGINAIVGPNGCGKSNIVDAIRWALGEQSVKLLRGAKMEEFIFNGTSNRNPLNLAEVALSFDEADNYLNTEYREIVITRRLYRSGEGEYYLNKTSCRLKDISELLWDTGIGTDTYSLIGQGRIEQVVNARPEERRELFEEAAGVNKYRQRRKETFQRLRDMEENLLRVEDLLTELSTQRDQLTERTFRAREYKGLVQELREVDKRLLILKYVKEEQDKRLIQQEQEKIKADIEEKRRILEEFKKEIIQFQNLEEDKEQKLKEEETIEADLTSKKEQVVNKLSDIRENKNLLSQKIEHKTHSFQEINTRIAGMEETIKSSEEDIKVITWEAQKLAEKTSQLKLKLSNLQHERNISRAEELKAEKEQLNLKLAALDQWFQDAYYQENELTKKLYNLEGQKEKKVKQHEDLKAAEEEGLYKLQELKQEQFKLNEKCQKLQKTWENLTSSLEEVRERVHNREREIYNKKLKLENLRENEDQLSYYGSGVRAIMQEKNNKGNFNDVHGPVAELIEVPSELEKAVDVALGAAVQFMVVEDENSAREAINFLKENKAGRVTFLPLNLVKPYGKEKTLPGDEGILGSASELVKTTQKYRKVVDYLLRGILLVSSLDTALAIIRRGRRDWKIVTLEGEALSPGGTISGGESAKERSGVFSRKAEMKGLKKEIEDVQGMIDKDKDKIADLEDQVKAKKTRFKETEQEKQRVESEYLELQNKINRISAQASAIAEELDNFKEQERDIQQQFNKLEEEKNKGKKEYEELKQDISAKEKLLQELNRSIGFKQQEIERLEKELVETRIRLSTLQEKESSLQQFINKQEKEKARLGEVSEELSQEISELKDEYHKLENEENINDDFLEEIENEIKVKMELLDALKEEVNSFKQEKEFLQERREKERRRIERLEKRQHELHIKIVTLNESLKYLQEQSLEKYNFELTQDLLGDESLQENEDELSLRKQHLQEKISSMGEINLGVIDEYERLNERISFLEEQRKDLLEGEQGAKDILRELDSYIEKRFLSTFQAVKENFNTIFNKLFGGGKAYLALSDPQNVLESGIDISAQPPGKKLQNIALLSGGEKALTGIALLFAVFEYKPAPFCVLDEIESSLDESNLQRFLALLRDYTSDTQFILITHRKKTMEEADVLFGVTMEEQGVSKTLSLSLTKKAG